MADYSFLDYRGLIFYHSELEKLFDKKLNVEQEGHGGKIMMVDADTEMIVPRLLALGQVDDVEVDGESVVTGRVAEINLIARFAAKQDNLTTDQMAVVNAKPFTETEKDKLAEIEEGAEVNLINSISVNETLLVPDENRNVDITVPEKLTDLDATDFDYVRSLSAGTSNVQITGTPPNLTISVAALEMPDEFTSTETPDPDSAIGDPLTGMSADEEVLTPIRTGAVLSEGDVVIFANNIQAVVTAIQYENEVPVTYDAIITRVPAEVSFAGITGNPMSNAALASALNGKMNVNMDNASLGAGNAGKYLYVSSGGAVAFGEIVPITNQQILDIIAGEIE